MRRLLHFSTVALVVILSGCAVRGDLPQTETISQRSLTIAVQADDTLSLQHIGTTVFNNVYATQQMTDWNFAARVRALSARTLRDNKTFKEVVEDDGTLATALAGVQPVMNTSFWKIGDVEKLVERRAELCKTDYLLLMRTSTTGDHLSGTNQALRGQGIHQRGLVGTSDRAIAFVNVSALVIDCKKKVEAGSSFGNGVIPLQFSLSKEKNLQLSGEQLDLAKGAVERAAESAIKSVLTRLVWLPGTN